MFGIGRKASRKAQHNSPQKGDTKSGKVAPLEFEFEKKPKTKKKITQELRE